MTTTTTDQDDEQKEEEEEQVDNIITPHEHDVLSGRGNFVNYHAGNEHFRALVRKHKVAYVACPKPQKGKFSRLIYDDIRSLDPPGRFLKQDAKTKLWYDIGEKKALDKTRQALREGAPGIMKELTGEDDEEGGGGEDEQQQQQQQPPGVNRSDSMDSTGESPNNKVRFVFRSLKLSDSTVLRIVSFGFFDISLETLLNDPSSWRNRS